MISIIGGIVKLGRLEVDLTKMSDRKESDQKRVTQLRSVCYVMLMVKRMRKG